MSQKEEDYIIRSFTNKEALEDFSVVLSYEEIITKNYSLSAGQYFEVKIDYVDISHEEFEANLSNYTDVLEKLFNDSNSLEKQIQNNLRSLKHE